MQSKIRDSPNLEGLVPVFTPPRNRVARLYPQALGSLFVASYDSQGYGGGIRTRLHQSTCKSELLYDWRFIANQFVLASSLLKPMTSIFLTEHLRL
jgi:hypothetical protein